MTTLIMVSILLFGLMSYRKLPVSDLPTVDFPTIQVSASVPGASPETMASAVATVLEKQFSTIAGIDSMNSVSVQGQTQVTLQFSLNRNIDAAAQDVQSAIARAGRQLPPDMPTPPSYQKVNPADQPIIYLVITSPTLPLSDLDAFGQTLLAQRISMIDGVAQVSVYGSQKYAVRVQVDPRKLFARDLSLNEVVAAIEQGNVNQPTGILYGPERAITVQANGQLMTASQYRPLIVTYRNGSPVRLDEIANVLDSVENDKAAAWYCNSKITQRALFLSVQRQPGMNTVQLANAIKNILPTLISQLPPSVSIQMLYDRSIPIQRSADDAQFTLVLTFCLVVMVIFIFLRSFTATIIPVLALPMSIIGTFVVMYLLDYSLDNLSLMALTLAIGFVVDDAIVMLENIVRHLEMGKSRMQASFDASAEISFTIVSMTLSLAAVFIPIIFMGGIVGRLFREFAITIGAAVLVSGVVSLTLTPMMCSRFLRPPKSIHHGRIYAFTERCFQAMLNFYDRTLTWSLDHRRSLMVFSMAVLIATVYLFIKIPKGFLPNEDQDRISIQTEAVEGISFTAMVKAQSQVVKIVQQDPDVLEFMSALGPRGNTATAGNNGRMFVHLRPRSERKATADQIVQRLRSALAGIPGITTLPQVPSTLQVGGVASKSQYQYTLQGPDIGELYRNAVLLFQQMKEMPGLIDITSDMQLKNPELNIEINRDLASSLGVSAAQVESTLYTAYGSRQISTIYAPNDQYQVIVELIPEYMKDPSVLSLLYVRSDSGKLIPVSTLASVTQDTGPLSINHFGQLPSVTLTFNLKPDVSLGDAVDMINRATREIPPTISSSFQGTAQAFQSSLKGMILLLCLAIFVIYIVLGILYENFFHPITILTALPFAGAGALIALFIFKAELHIYAFVGIIMLIGLVKKNGIMMIDFAIEAQKDGKTAREAIQEACLIRFRPIMMTTMAALMAGLPIAFGYGAGGEARRPLGLAVVGGLLFSQTLTLYVTPVFYLYMEKFQTWLKRNKIATNKAGA